MIQSEQDLLSALSAYLRAVEEVPTVAVVVGNVENRNVSSTIQVVRADLQLGLGALIYPSPSVVERMQLSLMIDIASLLQKLYRYIAQRDELLAGKNFKGATNRRVITDLLDSKVDIVFDEKVKNGDSQYEMVLSADAVFDRVYTYTAQKSRFISAAMVGKDKSVQDSGVDRGPDLWAMSPDERGVFDQLLQEGVSELGTLLYPLSRSGNKVATFSNKVVTCYFDKKTWITGALLRTLYGKIENLLVAYVLRRWYTIAGVVEEVKIHETSYGIGEAFMGQLCQYDDTEGVLRDFVRHAAVDMWSRISGYIPDEQMLLFDIPNPDAQTPQTDTDGKVVILLTLPRERVVRARQVLAENFASGLYHYALHSWYGMQEDRVEQDGHRVEYENHRSGMVVLLGRRS